MTIIIFAIILGLLVLVHELGHFLVAKKAGVRVDEFGFGYPPRALIIGKRWGTIFSLNWIPFGGFVKIFGEDGDETNEKEEIPQENTPQKVLGSPLQSRARLFSEHFPVGLENQKEYNSKKLGFTQVSKKWQASILVAGVVCNILFAWFLFSVGFMIGLPTPQENEFGQNVKNPTLTVVALLPDYPAKIAGIKSGDKIIKVFSGDKELLNPNTDNFSGFISSSFDTLNIEVLRGKEKIDFKINQEDILSEGKKMIGVNLDMVGTLSLPIHKAIWQGGKITFEITYLTVLGLFNLVKSAILGSADFSQISGPVGIVGLVGEATTLGFAYLLTFTALISINLAVINLVPFPALDGGRLLFVIIESITKKQINKKFVGWANSLGFLILVSLMFLVTYKDITKLF